MSITYKEDTAVFKETATVDEAETFLEWITEHENCVVDLSESSHIHTAVLQVLMAAEPHVTKMPEDDSFGIWLRNALDFKQEN